MAQAPGSTRGVALGVGPALAVGAWLRLTALDVHSLWFDE